MRNAASSIALGGGSAAGGLTVTSGSDAGGVPIFLPAFPAYGRASGEPKLTHLSRRTRKNWPCAPPSCECRRGDDERRDDQYRPREGRPILNSIQNDSQLRLRFWHELLLPVSHLLRRNDSELPEMLVPARLRSVPWIPTASSSATKNLRPDKGTGRAQPAPSRGGRGRRGDYRIVGEAGALMTAV